MLIYKITNVLNGKIYIGKTSTSIEQRWKLHIRHALVERRSTRLCNAIRKYGVQSFTIEHICCPIKRENDILNGLERELIASHNSQLPEIGYNISAGGDGGFTQDMRDKSAASRRLNGITPEHIAAMRQGRINAGPRPPKTAEQKERIRLRVKQYYTDHPEHRDKIAALNKNKAKSGSNHHFYGKTHTIEVKQANAARRRGKTYDELFGVNKAQQIKAKMSKQRLGTGNSNYKHLNSIIIVEMIAACPRLRVADIGQSLGVSFPTISKRIRAIFGVDNFQKFRENLTDEQIKDRCNEILSKAA